MLLSDSISNHQHAYQQTKGREDMEEIVQEQKKLYKNKLKAVLIIYNNIILLFINKMSFHLRYLW